MIRIKIDTKRVECIMHDTYHTWYISSRSSDRNSKYKKSLKNWMEIFWLL